MWAPEIYQCVSLPITVTRVVPVDDVDSVWKDSCHPSKAIEEDFLPFQFEVHVHVRELGDSMNLISFGSTIPPKEQIGEDTGKPLHPGLWGLCISCKQKDIVKQLTCTYKKSKRSSNLEYYGWPENRTLVIQKEAAHNYKEVIEFFALP